MSWRNWCMRLTSLKKRSTIVVVLVHDFAFDVAIFLASYIIDESADFFGRQQHVASSSRPVGVSFYPCASPLKASGFAANAWCRSHKGLRWRPCDSICNDADALTRTLLSTVCFNLSKVRFGQLSCIGTFDTSLYGRFRGQTGKVYRFWPECSRVRIEARTGLRMMPTRRSANSSARCRKRARQNSIRFGRKPKLTAYQRQEALERLAQDESQSTIARIFNVDRATISRLAQR
jgi:hypothetical protein